MEAVMEKLSQVEREDELKKLGIQTDLDRKSCMKEYEKYRKANYRKPIKKAKSIKKTVH